MNSVFILMYGYSDGIDARSHIVDVFSSEEAAISNREKWNSFISSPHVQYFVHKREVKDKPRFARYICKRSASDMS